MIERGDISRWVNKEKFKEFQQQKKDEKDNDANKPNRMEFIWKNPEKGTQDKPKVYELRFLQDKKGIGYIKYFYHMFKTGEKWNFILCPKTEGMTEYCPICSANQKLYTGGNPDKALARQIKRKEKYVGNVYIVDDPRDAEQDDAEKRVNGTVKLYEFPGKVETKLKEEITDTKHGLGYNIFDPGDDGYNFILKVFATKPQDGGMVWPDYSSSMFARRSSSVGTDSEIQNAMDSTVNLEDHIKGMKSSDEHMINVLKEAMIWDIVEEEVARNMGTTKTEVPSKSNSDEPKSESKEEDDIDDSQWDEDDSDNESDEELLNELKDM